MTSNQGETGAAAGLPLTESPLESFARQLIERWIRLGQAMRTANRFYPDDVALIDELTEACRGCERALPSGTVVFRARINPPEQKFRALGSSDLGAPPSAKASAGRLNPEGIRYLYTALEEATAVAEVRPWRQAAVSVASLRTTRSLRVVDLAGLPVHLSPVDRVTPMLLGGFLGLPVHRDDPLDYLPSQLLAARLGREGFDGVIYPSALQPSGTNLAIFDPSAVKFDRVALHSVEAVEVRSRSVVEILLGTDVVQRLLGAPGPQ